ncbi:SHOCT domain-containing protein [Natronococcus sp. A-GB7]|uniref:SHOCT domain-containing protein n=1 Tax=Natronococcus sp. A-GB7 TaxID=3037649 RepID=UPI00241C53AA|nr:SHOCT domain-containing protein [Natronococcus sp. A-GB7]MDG5817725.1 SHOCT domain-containing protein [Natronococcus sp. A-GB7]
MSGIDPVERIKLYPAILAFPALGVLIVGGLLGSTALLAAGILGLLAVPMLVLLFGDSETVERWWGAETADRLDADTEETNAENDAFEVLKRRYASDDIDEATFERRVQTLLDANALAESSPGSNDPPSDERTRVDDRTDSKLPHPTSLTPYEGRSLRVGL